MTTETIAVLSPGDMGHAVGRVLATRGYRVITCLGGRSARTAALAAAGGLADRPDLDTVVAEAQLILSILPPAAALGQAEDVAAAIGRAGVAPVYLDCNAVSPATAGRIGEAITAAGAPFIDGGIIGPAPGKGRATRLYVSGPDCTPVAALSDSAFEVIPIGAEIGRASGLKMCYAALTKGTFTLHAAVLLAAAALGLTDELRAELEFSQQKVLARMQATVPRLPADAGRWIGEMEEIRATFAAAGVTPDFHQGAAEVFRLLDRTPFAAETRETIDMDRGLDETVRALADLLPMRT